MSILSDRIKKERENLKLTREELANKIGVSYSAIAMYERGEREPNNELTLKMCEIFNCSIDYLMGNSNYKTYEEAFNNFMINQNEMLILKTIDRYYNEFIVPCSLKENDIDFIVKILSNVTKQNVKEKKRQIDLYINSFNENTRGKVKELLNIIIKELMDDVTNKSIFYNLNTMVNKDNKDNCELSPKFFMIPVYRSYFCWTT